MTEIAHLAVETLGLPAGSVEFCYSGGDRGWKGDVPLLKIRNEKIKDLGWSLKNTSREAMSRALKSMV